MNVFTEYHGLPDELYELRAGRIPQMRVTPDVIRTCMDAFPHPAAARLDCMCIRPVIVAVIIMEFVTSYAEAIRQC